MTYKRLQPAHGGDICLCAPHIWAQITKYGRVRSGREWHGRLSERKTFIEAVCGLFSALLFLPVVNVTHGHRLQRREISHCSRERTRARARSLDFLTAAELPGRECREWHSMMWIKLQWRKTPVARRTPALNIIKRTTRRRSLHIIPSFEFTASRFASLRWRSLWACYFSKKSYRPSWI